MSIICGHILNHTRIKRTRFLLIKTKENPPKYNLHFLKEETTNEGGELRNAIYRFLVNEVCKPVC